MKWVALTGRASLCAISIMLASCGGGSSGGVGTTPPPPTPAPTPTPTPTPAPAPSNTDVGNLEYSETFEVDAAQNETSFDLTAGTTSSTSAAGGQIAIDYDAATDSYTVRTGSRSQTFAPSDRVETGFQGEQVFEKPGAGQSDYLTLTNSSFASGLETRYVALGFWQSNQTAGGVQDMNFDVFTYGFPTGASAVPRTGSAQYTTDIFGLTTQAGDEPLTFQGTGSTIFDLDRGTFSLSMYVDEYYLVTGAERYGALSFNASGNLNSGDGGFSGTFLYAGSLDPVAGTLTGSFYGPTGEEAGGVFNGDDGMGNSVVGGFTAAAGGPVIQNIALTDLNHDQLFYTAKSEFFSQQRKDDPAGGYTMASIQNGQFHFIAGSGYRVAGYVEAEGGFEESERTDSPGDAYAVYEKTVNGEHIQLSLYKPDGPGEIELTYASFGEYYRVTETPEVSAITRTFFMYGLPTPEGVLDARTGSATYRGIAFGAAGSSDGQRQLSVAGTSLFEIDFSSRGYSGWLRLEGTDRQDGSTLDFGQFDLLAGTSSFFPGNAFTAGLASEGSDEIGQIQLRFYGPTGEEMAGAFNIGTLDGYTIGGATAAVRD